MYLSLHVEINNAQTRFHFGFYFEHFSYRLHCKHYSHIFTHIQSTMHAFGEFMLSAQCFRHEMEYAFQPSLVVHDNLNSLQEIYVKHFEIECAFSRKIRNFPNCIPHSIQCAPVKCAD